MPFLFLHLVYHNSPQSSKYLVLELETWRITRKIFQLLVSLSIDLLETKSYCGLMFRSNKVILWRKCSQIGYVPSERKLIDISAICYEIFIMQNANIRKVTWSLAFNLWSNEPLLFMQMKTSYQFEFTILSARH